MQYDKNSFGFKDLLQYVLSLESLIPQKINAFTNMAEYKRRLYNDQYKEAMNAISTITNNKDMLYQLMQDLGYKNLKDLAIGVQKNPEQVAKILKMDFLDPSAQKQIGSYFALNIADLAAREQGYNSDVMKRFTDTFENIYKEQDVNKRNSLLSHTINNLNAINQELKNNLYGESNVAGASQISVFGQQMFNPNRKSTLSNIVNLSTNILKNLKRFQQTGDITYFNQSKNLYTDLKKKLYNTNASYRDSSKFKNIFNGLEILGR